MPAHEKLDYVEFAAKDLERSKVFFEKAFAWEFEDYGPDYTAFNNQGLNGGFYRAEHCSRSENGGALLIFYSRDLENCLRRVADAGGIIVKDIFEFPGGRRFHFCEPSGNEFAVWSDNK